MPISVVIPQSSKRVRLNDDPTSATADLAIPLEEAKVSQKAFVVEPKQEYKPTTKTALLL